MAWRKRVGNGRGGRGLPSPPSGLAAPFGTFGTLTGTFGLGTFGPKASGSGICD